MADFDVDVTASVGTLVLESWKDPATVSEPSRINPRPGLPHLRRRVQEGDTVRLTAVVNGTPGPDDSALGGRLFQAWVAEQPGLGDPAFLQIVANQPDSNKTSIQDFVLAHAGHYTLVMFREGGGSHLVHVDALAP